MSKSTDKEFKDQNTLSNSPIVTDTTPWFWVTGNKQKPEQLGFRFIGMVYERPTNPRHWDMIYNTDTWKIEIYIAQAYRWPLVPSVTQPFLANPWTYIDYLGELRYTENGTTTPGLPWIPDWIRANTVSQWIPLDGYSYINNATVDQNIPTGAYTAIGATSNDYVLSTIPVTRWAQNATIVRTWQYLLHWYVTRLQKSGETLTELRLMIDGTQVAYDSHVIPSITAVTTWTDSVGWAISASTVITIGNMDYVTQRVSRYGRLEAWQVISAEVRQNSWWNLAVTPWLTFPTTTQYQTWFSIIWL